MNSYHYLVETLLCRSSISPPMIGWKCIIGIGTARTTGSRTLDCFHRHCHDTVHSAQDKGHQAEKLHDRKRSRAVLQRQGRGNLPPDRNRLLLEPQHDLYNTTVGGPMPADQTAVVTARAPRGQRHPDGGTSTDDRRQAIGRVRRPRRSFWRPHRPGAHLGRYSPAVAGMTARTSLEHPVTGTTIPLTRPLACGTRCSQASSPARSAAPGSWRAFVPEASA